MTLDVDKGARISRPLWSGAHCPQSRRTRPSNITAHKDGWFEGAGDNGGGVASMLGLAEYFAKIPKEKRRRTIIFIGLDGHHNGPDGAAGKKTWLTANKDEAVREDRHSSSMNEHPSTITTQSRPRYYPGDELAWATPTCRCNAKAYSAASATSPLASTTIARRDPTEHDVQIEILFCGICHSDLHQVRNEWSERRCPPSTPAFPAMRSSAASPRSAPRSRSSSPATSPPSAAWSTPTAPAPSARRASSSSARISPSPTTFPTSISEASPTAATPTASSSTERFVLRVPSNLDLAGAAPLLCAGITTYSPMRHWGVTKGKKVGVVGLGGLGHMGVKFAHALGAHVVVFTTSPNKKDDALRLGADEVVISRNADEMEKHAGSFDFILDAVSADHDINAYINLLRRDGNITLVGAPEKPLAVSAFGLHHGPPQPLRLAHRRHRRNPGDARLLRQAQHHRRCRSHPDPEGQRSLREAAQVGCEVPLLHRHGFAQIRVYVR